MKALRGFAVFTLIVLPAIGVGRGETIRMRNGQVVTARIWGGNTEAIEILNPSNDLVTIPFSDIASIGTRGAPSDGGAEGVDVLHLADGSKIRCHLREVGGGKIDYVIDEQHQQLSYDEVVRVDLKPRTPPHPGPGCAPAPAAIVQCAQELLAAVSEGKLDKVAGLFYVGVLAASPADVEARWTKLVAARGPFRKVIHCRFGSALRSTRRAICEVAFQGKPAEVLIGFRMQEGKLGTFEGQDVNGHTAEARRSPTDPPDGPVELLKEKSLQLARLIQDKRFAEIPISPYNIAYTWQRPLSMAGEPGGCYEYVDVTGGGKVTRPIFRVFCTHERRLISYHFVFDGEKPRWMAYTVAGWQ